MTSDDWEAPAGSDKIARTSSAPEFLSASRTQAASDTSLTSSSLDTSATDCPEAHHNSTAPLLNSGV